MSLPSQSSVYSLKLEFGRHQVSDIQTTSVNMHFDTSSKWVTLGIDCFTEPQPKPSSRIGTLLWRLRGKKTYSFLRSVTVVRASDLTQKKLG
jgi:hypothetical protein